MSDKDTKGHGHATHSVGILADPAALSALWDEHARRDPLWAVLAYDDKKSRGWALRDFMKLGEREIALAVHRCAELGIDLGFGSALDFGCAVGRLTQALARRFDHAIGVDISSGMIAMAEALNKYPGRAEYRQSETGVSAVPDNSIDFIYTAMVLQHVPPELAETYLVDLIRVLRPGGALVFQIPSHQIELTTAETRPLPDAGYRASVAFRRAAPLELIADAPHRLDLRVANTSTVDWIQRNLGSLRVGNHWLDESGELMVAQDDGRSVMPQEVPAGTWFDVDLTVTPPSTPGRYTLEVDVVHEAVSWFGDKGSDRTRAVVEVTPGQSPTTGAALVRELAVPEYDETGLSPDAEDMPTGETLGFPMFGISRARIAEIVDGHGAALVSLEEDSRAGHDWVSYRYFVRKASR